jgi:hypothetical protein
MALADLTPTLAEVGSHIRVRTKDSNGNELGTFNADTRPTDDQITPLLVKGARAIASHIGTEICEGDDEERQEELYGDAKDFAALRVAMRIERSYFAEQVGSGKSPYKEMLDEYKEGIATLIEAVAEHCSGGDGESIGGPGPMPQAGFPPASGIAGMQW